MGAEKAGIFTVAFLDGTIDFVNIFAPMKSVSAFAVALASVILKLVAGSAVPGLSTGAAFEVGASVFAVLVDEADSCACQVSPSLNRQLKF